MKARGERTLLPDRAHHVGCDVCRRSVPRADALSAGGKEYVAYFCE